MNRTKAGTLGRAGMLAAIAALVALVAVLPMFGRPAYATGLNLDGVVTVSEFTIPGIPMTKLAEKFPPLDTHGIPKEANCALVTPDMPIASVPNPKSEDRPLNATADMWACAPPGPPGAPFNRLDFHTGAPQDNLRIGGVVAQCLEAPVLALGQWKKTIEGFEAWGVDFSGTCYNSPTGGPALNVWLVEYAEANCTLEKQDVNAPGKPATPQPAPGEYDQWKCAPKITNPYAQGATFATESAQIQVADAPKLQNVVFYCHATGEAVNVPDAKVPGVWQGDFQGECKGGFDVYTKSIDPANKPDIDNAYALFPSTNATIYEGVLYQIAHNNGPYVLTLSEPADIFPPSGELLLGKTELVVYNTTSPCGVITLGPNDVCVTQRAKVGEKKQHEPGTSVKLATQLTSEIVLPAAAGAGDGARTTLTAAISATAGGCTAIGPPPEQNQAKCPLVITPFKITVASRANFPASGFITISHQQAQTANLMGSGNATEYMEYDLTSCGALGANQLCIVARAQQANNQAHSHDASGYAQPGHQAGVTNVNLHFQIDVNSNVGFFPNGELVVYNVDETNNIVNAEVMGFHNSAPKIKDMTGNTTQIHMVSRGAPTSTFEKTDIVQHKQGSIVTSPDIVSVSRNGLQQPGVDTDIITPGIQEPAEQVPGTSVGLLSVLYSQDQPAGPPKTFFPEEAKQLHVPIIGSTLIVLSAIAGQPYLSTGGFDHVVLGPVPHIDRDGTAGDVDDLDGDGITDESVLGLISPCILELSPGTNMQTTVILQLDKDYATPDSGTISVVLDTIHDSPNDGSTPADDCDDPPGIGDITNYSYIYPNDPDQSDDDTDGDGCSDVEELQSNQKMGGLRDPWNPYDYFDVNGDSYIDLFNDILGVISSYSAGGGTYDAAKDRGALLYGPFGWNRAQPDGSIDLFNDILGVIGQYQHDCRPAP